jgi:glycerophosphoryl diester phosphodiesterase
MSKNFAHRGFSAQYPENTMLAFQKALDIQCDGIEFDVHLTRDGEIVIIHDESLERTTNGHGFVKDKDYAELRKLDAGNGERIPTLDEYFDLTEKTPILSNIELKNSVFRYEGMEKIIIEKIRRRKMEDQIIFSSFNHYSMLRCKELAPEICCGLLVLSWIIDAGAYAKKYGMENIHPEFCSLTDEAIAEIKSRGIAIYTYTVNAPEDMKRLSSLGVDAIITNDPQLLRRTLS